MAGFFLSASNEESLLLLLKNIEAFRDAGLYEPALLHAFSATRTNHARWDLRTLGNLFRIADRAKLRAAGDPMPPGETFTLYRGVAGREPLRKEAGYSWTLSPESATSFALRLYLPNPAVVVTQARAEDVLAYLHEGQGRNEAEMIYLAEHWERAEPMPPLVWEGANDDEARCVACSKPFVAGDRFYSFHGVPDEAPVHYVCVAERTDGAPRSAGRLATLTCGGAKR